MLILLEEMTIQNQLEKIHNGVKKFQRQLTDVKPTPEWKSHKIKYQHLFLSQIFKWIF